MARLLFLTILVMDLSFFISCQSNVISEIGSNTCIPFVMPNTTSNIHIQKDTESLCIKVDGANVLTLNAWNRTFSCSESSNVLSVCFTNTRRSDAGKFTLVVGTNTDPEYNSTLTVQYPAAVLPLSDRTVAEGSNVTITCYYSAGNPNTTTVYWTRQASTFRQNSQTLSLENIQRSSAGTYICTTKTVYSSFNTGTDIETMAIDIQYPPTVSSFNSVDIMEGDDITVTCNYSAGNPNSTIVYWTISNLGLRQNDQTLNMTNIQRGDSGDYVCTVENVYSIGGGGSNSQTMSINVQYPPSVSSFSPQYPVELTDFSAACTVVPGNPPNTEMYWTRSGEETFQQNSTHLRLFSINRNDSGTYKCTAENTYSSGSKGSNSQTLVVDVQYPPLVSPIADLKPVEGSSVRVQCIVTQGNPSSTSTYWIKAGNSGFRQYSSTLSLYNIRRSYSGTYYCVAENSYRSGGKGQTRQPIVLDVLYGPVLIHQDYRTVSEGQGAHLSTTLTSNPPSNVSWYRGNNLLSTQRMVNGTTIYTIPSAQCTDTGTFSVVASNGISNHTTSMLLYVNCSPRLNPPGNSVDIPVADDRHLNGLINVLSYPSPNYTLTLPNGAPNTLISLIISVTTTNIFVITLRKSNIQPEDYGKYTLEVSNNYGKRKIKVNIIPRGKPLKTSQVLVSCGFRKAHVTWQSSYFGYLEQGSFVQYSIRPNAVLFFNGSEFIPERTKHRILRVTVLDLQDNNKFFFRVVTSNEFGFSTSSIVNCTTDAQREASSTSSVSIAVGGVLGPLLLLSIVALVLVTYKYLKERKPDKESKERFEAYAVIETSGDVNVYESCQYRTYENHAFSQEGVKGSETKASTSADKGNTKPSTSADKGERLYENVTKRAAKPKKPKPKPKPKPKS